MSRSVTFRWYVNQIRTCPPVDGEACTAQENLTEVEDFQKALELQKQRLDNLLLARADPTFRAESDEAPAWYNIVRDEIHGRPPRQLQDAPPLDTFAPEHCWSDADGHRFRFGLRGGVPVFQALVDTQLATDDTCLRFAIKLARPAARQTTWLDLISQATALPPGRDVVQDAMVALLDHAAFLAKRVDSFLFEPCCRICGCDSYHACEPDEGSCHWVEEDLCSCCEGEWTRTLLEASKAPRSTT